MMLETILSNAILVAEAIEKLEDESKKDNNG